LNAHGPNRQLLDIERRNCRGGSIPWSILAE
jgi:hypothetical protein